MSEQQFFNAILGHEKKGITDYIQKNNIPCIIKLYDSVLKTQFLKTLKNEFLIFKNNSFPIINEKITVSFESVGEQFFFESVATSAETKLVVQIPEKIYKLQRRNDFRVAMPMNIQPIIKFKPYPDLRTEIRDMSLGGCKLAIKSASKLDLVIDQRTEMHIKVLQFEEKQLPVTIKFIDYLADAKTTVLGIKFSDFSSEQTALMRNTLLQLDRILRQKSQD
jgi:c-di-GMP-binding flagellar brake protein YcgR